MIRDLPAAVLFDMDGTLVDTEPFWIRAEHELVESYGGQWTHEDALRVIGAGLWVSGSILQDHGVELPVDDIVHHLTDRVREQIREHGVPWRPGALELLTDIRDHDIPTALVTMSLRPMAEQVVSLIPFDAFDALVTGDAVQHPKPDPEAYLSAAAILGVDPARSIAIEDSVSGLASACAAGAVVIAVPHIAPIEAADGYIVWPTLAGRGVRDLAELMRADSAEAVPAP